ncbi:hypothetical protein EHS25_001625 [Saitozyma podzolica]|uniref:Uncharacterized protein n=1 Tax=Saitozyma podzolica TaxID=1890683 RepID=A0A427YGK6_9TREE|nr:hypothetical protein EHS25_001625 [Saitozyma podzolica]
MTYQHLQILHRVIFEDKDQSASASRADRAARASRLLGVTVEPNDAWFGPSLEAQVRRRVHCIETAGFADEALNSIVRCSDLMKTLYERSGRGRAHAQVLGMDDTINLTAFEVEIFEDSYQGRVQRSLLVLQAHNPSASELTSFTRTVRVWCSINVETFRVLIDELRPEAVLATIDAIGKLTISRNSGNAGDGQSSSDAQSSQAAA